MKIALLTYFISAILLSVIRFSLLKGERLQWLAFLIPGLICSGFYNFSLNQNNRILDWLLQQDNLVSGIAILLTFEAILIVFLTVVQIKSHYAIKHPDLWKWISVIPLFQLVVALVFCQTYLFLKVSGYSFIVLTLIFFLGSVLVLGILAIGFQKVIKKWEIRAEAQALIALFQLLLAMFLPLMARGQKVGFTQITVDYFSILFTIALTILLSTIGYFSYKRKNKQLT